MISQDCIAVALQINVPALVWGLPGLGKTKSLEAIAQALEAFMITMIAAIREPADFIGMPYIEDGRTRYACPRELLRLVEHQGMRILFLDEISTAPPAVQNALLRLVLERVAGEQELSPEIRMIAAGNPPDMAAGATWYLQPALANRFAHFEWELGPTAWCEGFVDGWPAPDIPIVPSDWEEKHLSRAESLVAAYIRRYPDSLHVMPKEESVASHAWASKRTWEYASKMLAASFALEGNGRSDLRLALIAGCVGEQQALQFATFLEQLDLPDPEDLLAAPETCEIPDRADRLNAVLNAVTMAVENELSEERWLSGVTILHRAADGNGRDVAAAAALRFAEMKQRKWKTPEEFQIFSKIFQDAGVHQRRARKKKGSDKLSFQTEVQS